MRLWCESGPSFLSVQYSSSSVSLIPLQNKHLATLFIFIGCLSISGQPNKTSYANLCISLFQIHILVLLLIHRLSSTRGDLKLVFFCWLTRLTRLVAWKLRILFWLTVASWGNGLLSLSSILAELNVLCCLARGNSIITFYVFLSLCEHPIFLHSLSFHNNITKQKCLPLFL